MDKHLSSYETDGVPVDGGYFASDLHAIAKRVGIAGHQEMTKPELIHHLNRRLENRTR